MQVIPDALRATDLPRGGVVTVGNYDGIHRGQRQMLDRVVRARASSRLRRGGDLSAPSVRHPAARTRCRRR